MVQPLQASVAAAFAVGRRHPEALRTSIANQGNMGIDVELIQLSLLLWHDWVLAAIAVNDWVASPLSATWQSGHANVLDLEASQRRPMSASSME